MDELIVVQDGIPDAAPQVRAAVPVSAQVTVAAPGAARVAPVVAPVRVAQAPLRIAQAPVRVAQRQRVAPTPQLVQFTRQPVFQSAPLQFAPRRVFQTSPRQIEQFIQDVQFDSVDADQVRRPFTLMMINLLINSFLSLCKFRTEFLTSPCSQSSLVVVSVKKSHFVTNACTM